MKEKISATPVRVPGVQAVNSRYKGAMMGDVARALMHPKSLEIREALERRQRKDNSN